MIRQTRILSPSQHPLDLSWVALPRASLHPCLHTLNFIYFHSTKALPRATNPYISFYLPKPSCHVRVYCSFFTSCVLSFGVQIIFYSIWTTPSRRNSPATCFFCTPRALFSPVHTRCVVLPTLSACNAAPPPPLHSPPFFLAVPALNQPRNLKWARYYADTNKGELEQNIIAGRMIVVIASLWPTKMAGNSFLSFSIWFSIVFIFFRVQSKFKWIEIRVQIMFLVFFSIDGIVDDD